MAAMVDQWATSRNGRYRIRLHNTSGCWEVYALFTGTHDLAPRTRTFDLSPAGEAAARAYANEIWSVR